VRIGPPVSAPIAVRVVGPNIEVLDRLAAQVETLLEETDADSTFKPPALARLAAEGCLNSPLPAPAASPELLLWIRPATIAATESPALCRAPCSGTNRPKPAAGGCARR